MKTTPRTYWDQLGLWDQTNMPDRAQRITELLVSDCSLTPRRGMEQLRTLVQEREKPAMDKVAHGLYIEAQMAILDRDFDQAKDLLEHCERIASPSLKRSLKIGKYITNCQINKAMEEKGYITSHIQTDTEEWLLSALNKSMDEKQMRCFSSRMVQLGYTKETLEKMTPWEIDEMASNIGISDGHIITLKQYVLAKMNPCVATFHTLMEVTTRCFKVQKKYNVDATGAIGNAAKDLIEMEKKDIDLTDTHETSDDEETVGE